MKVEVLPIEVREHGATLAKFVFLDDAIRFIAGDQRRSIYHTFTDRVVWDEAVEAFPSLGNERVAVELIKRRLWQIQVEGRAVRNQEEGG